MVKTIIFLFIAAGLVLGVLPFAGASDLCCVGKTERDTKGTCVVKGFQDGRICLEETHKECWGRSGCYQLKDLGSAAVGSHVVVIGWRAGDQMCYTGPNCGKVIVAGGSKLSQNDEASSAPAKTAQQGTASSGSKPVPKKSGSICVIGNVGSGPEGARSEPGRFTIPAGNTATNLSYRNDDPGGTYTKSTIGSAVYSYAQKNYLNNPATLAPGNYLVYASGRPGARAELCYKLVAPGAQQSDQDSSSLPPPPLPEGAEGQQQAAPTASLPAPQQQPHPQSQPAPAQEPQGPATDTIEKTLDIFQKAKGLFK